MTRAQFAARFRTLDRRFRCTTQGLDVDDLRTSLAFGIQFDRNDPVPARNKRKWPPSPHFSRELKA
jgi:hypothetical protein